MSTYSSNQLRSISTMTTAITAQVAVFPTEAASLTMLLTVQLVSSHFILMLIDFTI